MGVKWSDAEGKHFSSLIDEHGRGDRLDAKLLHPFVVSLNAIMAHLQPRQLMFLRESFNLGRRSVQANGKYFKSSVMVSTVNSLESREVGNTWSACSRPKFDQHNFAAQVP